MLLATVCECAVPIAAGGAPIAGGGAPIAGGGAPIAGGGAPMLLASASFDRSGSCLSSWPCEAMKEGSDVRSLLPACCVDAPAMFGSACKGGPCSGAGDALC